jgi:hypothetical protein
MSIIEQLTDAQIAKFPEYVKRWTEIGLCTDAADRPRAEAAIVRMYEIGRKKEPKRIIWCGSPLSSGLVYTVLKKKLGESVGESVRESVWQSVRQSVYGQHDANWLAFYRFFHDECGLIPQTEKLDGLWELCRSANWAMPFSGFCFVSERHDVVRQDAHKMLHCEFGPAVHYPDGFSIWAWHGVRVPQRVIESPETIAAKEVWAEPNAEIRRVMMERVGNERLLKESGAEQVHSHERGTLFHLPLPKDDPEGHMRVVHVKDPSTDREYYLRVPPYINRADDAVAWTFGFEMKNSKEYQPLVET